MSDKAVVNVFSDLNKFNSLLRPFEYQRFAMGLRGFVDTYGPKLLPWLNAHAYCAVNEDEIEGYLDDRLKDANNRTFKLKEFEEGVKMLGDCLSAHYNDEVAVTMVAHTSEGAGDEPIRPGGTVMFVMEAKFKNYPSNNFVKLACYEVRDYPQHLLDELVPSINDRSINDPSFLMPSKTVDRFTQTGRYSYEYAIDKVIRDALAKGWYRVDRHGHQLLFTANLRLC